MAIVGFCKLCGAPAHVQWYDDIYCYECGKKVVKRARVPAADRPQTAEGGARAPKKGET